MNSKLITYYSFGVSPSERLRQRHLLYAGEPLRVAPLALCRETRPPQWLTVHRNGSLITCA
ncbi:hypothetical protein [Calothrix rhizosoleniae]|uniref:hypothetical protein n=1 Tax=Calothrix rhizosoleniae TaxID=888997 RepID=UPI001178AD66|nr:hypothetical protein [Calothrix rhizosoleniae]